MITGRSRFNLNLLLIALTALIAAGCRSSDEPAKEFSTLRVHMEVLRDQPGFTTTVPIVRARPIMLNVSASPVLTETHLSEATVVETPGGFDLQLQFDRQGALLLEECTGSNPGRRLAVFCFFGAKGKEEGRWLGAPVVPRRIADGVLVFTPDATREETEKVALALNNTVKQNSGKYRW